MVSNPFVSILMTAYNRQEFIAEAIESVLASTYQHWELIIVDDGSTDNTVNIAKGFEAKDSRIKVYSNEKNLGDYPNRNKAALLAKGEYMVFVDSDDKILPGGIQKLVEAMELFPGSSFGMYSPLPGTPYELKSDEAIYNHFFKEPFLMMGPGGTIQRLSFFKKLNGYPEKYGPANDMYYNLKACCHSSIVIMPFEFMYYRRHEGQEINNASSYLYNSYLYLKDAIS
jgi:glycosyltransferase involved in cell wall biosynthesis